MALFKVSKGLNTNLPTTLTEGYCWYTYDDSKFYIDFKDENGVLTRKALNALEAEKLTGYDIATILNSSNVEIPTSKAVLDALNTKADIDHTHDAVFLKNLNAILPVSEEWTAVTYGGDKFVAIAESTNQAAYSTDGINWTLTTMPSSANWRAVAYGDDRFMAIAYGSNKAAYSLDGITWTESTMPAYGDWVAIAHNGQKFIAIQPLSSVYAYTSTGTSWDTGAMPSEDYWTDIIAKGSMFYAAAEGTSVLYMSADGYTWDYSYHDLPGGSVVAIQYGDGTFVALGGGNGEASYSTNGDRWIETTMETRDWYDVAYGNGKFVTVASDSNVAAYTTDGAIWTETTLPVNATWISVTYGNGVFVAVAQDSDVCAFSYDGITWMRNDVGLKDKDGNDISEEIVDLLEVARIEDIQDAISSNQTIIDVSALPTENINENAFYRVSSGSLVRNYIVYSGYTCHCVESLPSVGLPATNADPAANPDQPVTDLYRTAGDLYYTVADAELYGYVDDALSTILALSVGWHPAATIFGVFDYEYAGVITALVDCPTNGTFCLLLDYTVYSYKDGWSSHKVVGRTDVGAFAEAFNHPSTTAPGDYAHAEGYYTCASETAAHAEGMYTYATETGAHSEGFETYAMGHSSHTEGCDTYAKGSAAHAEGNGNLTYGRLTGASNSTTYTIDYVGDVIIGACVKYDEYVDDVLTTHMADIVSIDAENSTITLSQTLSADTDFDDERVDIYVAGMALGDYSHAEGNQTIAACQSQHVQGEFNIIDPEFDVNNDKRGRYAHIVGNGDVNTRSNAHTLDWSGNAWFAGDIRVGGTSYDDGVSLLPKRTTVTLSASAWTGTSNPWSQVVTINGVTANSKLDLLPTATQIVELQSSEITLMLQNDDGIVTAWAINGKPNADLTMQVLIQEVIPV